MILGGRVSPQITWTSNRIFSGVLFEAQTRWAPYDRYKWCFNRKIIGSLELFHPTYRSYDSPHLQLHQGRTLNKVEPEVFLC